MKKSLTALGAAAAITTGLIADSTKENICSSPSISITYQNIDKRPSGFEPIGGNGPSTAADISMQCGKVNASVWTMTGKNGVNEQDFTLAYSLRETLQEVLGDNFDGGVNVAHWNSPENKWQKSLVGANIQYTGLPVDIRASVSQLLDSEKGQQALLTAAKSFDITDSLSAQLDYTAAILKDFFGKSGFTNQSVGFSVHGNTPNGITIGAFVRQHDAQQEGFHDRTQFGVNASYSF